MKKNVRRLSSKNLTIILIVSMFLIAVLVGILASLNPVFFAGIFFILAFSIFALMRPRDFLFFLLLTGGISLAFLTDKRKPFFADLGGINLDGMRLLGFVFVMLLYLSLRMKAAFKVIIRYKLYVFFLLFAGFSIFYSIGREIDGFRLIFKLLYPFLLFIIIQVETRNFSDIKNYEKAVLGGGILVSVLGLINVLRGNAFIIGIEGVRQYTAGLAHPNMMAFFLLVVLLVSFISYIYYRKRIYLYFSLILFVQLGLTFTRSALISLVICLLILVLRRANVVVAVSVPIVIFLLVVFLIFNVTALKIRMFEDPEDATFSNLVSNPVEFIENVRMSGRNNLWRYAIENVYKKNPWIGGGLGATDIIIGKEWAKHGWNIDVTGGVPVHNEYIRMLCELGLIGLMIFIVVNLRFLKDMVKIYKKSIGNVHFERLALTAMLLMTCYLIICITSNVINWYTLFSQYVFAYMGLSFKAKEFSEQKESSNTSGKDS